MTLATADLDVVLSEIGTRGPYFATDPVVARGSRPVVDLLDGAALTNRITATRSALASMAGVVSATDVEWRVAASITQLGICARLLAPVFGVATLTGRVLTLDLHRARWLPVRSGPVPLWLGGCSLGDRVIDDPAELAAELETALHNPLSRFVDAAAAVGAGARGLLWGNVASGLAGAAATVGSNTHMAAVELRDAMLAAPTLAGTSQQHADGAFRRRSCCLIYRVGAGAGFCGDCALTGFRGA